MYVYPNMMQKNIEDRNRYHLQQPSTHGLLLAWYSVCIHFWPVSPLAVFLPDPARVFTCRSPSLLSFSQSLSFWSQPSVTHTSSSFPVIYYGSTPPLPVTCPGPSPSCFYPSSPHRRGVQQGPRPPPSEACLGDASRSLGIALLQAWRH